MISASTSGHGLIVRDPPPALAPFVQHVGHYEGQLLSGREYILPTGTLALVVNLGRDMSRWYAGDQLGRVCTGGGALLLSASAGRIGADLRDWNSGAFVSFRPGGAYPFLEMPASAIDEPVVELAALWGRAGSVLPERLRATQGTVGVLAALEAALLERARWPLAPDPAVAAAAAMLGRGAEVGEVADRVGLSETYAAAALP